jgi:Ca2+/H+ antiporter, TMEM165/GDT1 family
MNNFLSSLILGFTLLLTNELGDRTFFLTVMFCSGNSLIKVFSASFSALLLNSALSIFFGKYILPLFLQTKTIEIMASILMFVFGVWMVWTAFINILKKRNNPDDLEKHEKSSLPTSFSQIFFIIFLAEFGDRSQLATFALSASHVTTEYEKAGTINCVGH